MKPKPKRLTTEVHVPHDVIFNHILPRIPAKSLCRFKCVSKEWHSFLTSYMFHSMHKLWLVSPFILNILPRLPAESVCRFKCLSKEWHLFLTSNMFQNMYIDHHRKNSQKVLFLSKTRTSCRRTLYEFMTIDYEASLSEGLITSFHPFKPFRDIHILTSFHGLVCLGIIKDEPNVGYSHLSLWNPLTNESKCLSKSNFHKECHNIRYSGSGFGLYYSCCEDDYKLLFVDFLNNNVDDDFEYWVRRVKGIVDEKVIYIETFVSPNRYTK